MKKILTLSLLAACGGLVAAGLTGVSQANPSRLVEVSATRETSLEDVKAAAVEKVSNYVNLDDYTEEGGLLIRSIIRSAVEGINSSRNEEQVGAYLNQALSQIATVPTKASEDAKDLYGYKNTMLSNLSVANNALSKYCVITADNLKKVVYTAQYKVVLSEDFNTAFEIYSEAYNGLLGIYSESLREFHGVMDDFYYLVDAIAETNTKLDDLMASMEGVYAEEDIAYINSIKTAFASDREVILYYVAYYQYNTSCSRLGIDIQAYVEKTIYKVAMDYVAKCTTLDEAAKAKLAADIASAKEALIAAYPEEDYTVNLGELLNKRVEALAMIDESTSQAYLAEMVERANDLMDTVSDDDTVEEEVDMVMELIDAIGDVTFSRKSSDAIKLARRAFNELNRREAALVENIDVLLDAEELLGFLTEAQPAIALINAIGEVSYRILVKFAIDDAREAYDALSEGAKACVSEETLKILTDAEETYAALKEQANTFGCAGSVAAASGLVTLVTLLGAGLLVSKKKER